MMWIELSNLSPGKAPLLPVRPTSEHISDLTYKTALWSECPQVVFLEAERYTPPWRQLNEAKTVIDLLKKELEHELLRFNLPMKCTQIKPWRNIAACEHQEFLLSLRRRCACLIELKKPHLSSSQRRGTLECCCSFLFAAGSRIVSGDNRCATKFQRHPASMQPNKPVDPVPLQQTRSKQSDNGSLGVSRASSSLHHPGRSTLDWRLLTSRKRAIHSKAALALALWSMVAVMLIYVCMRSPVKVVKPGLQQRSLAAGGSEGGGSEDDFLNSVLEECLATTTPLESQEEEDEEPAAKIARLELFLRNAASVFEQPGASQPAALQRPDVSPEPPSYPPTSPPSVGTSTSDSPTAAVEPSPQLEADSWLQQIPYIQGPLDASERLTYYDPNAWLEGISDIMQYPHIEGMHKETAGTSPAVWQSWPELPATSAEALLQPGSVEGPSISGVPSARTGLAPYIAAPHPLQQEPFTGVFPSQQTEAAWLQQAPQVPLQRQAAVQIIGPGAPGQFHRTAAGKPFAIAVPSSPGSLQHEGFSTPAAGAHSGRSPSSENLAAGATDVAEGTPEGAPASASGATLAEFPERRPWCPADHPYVRLPDVDPGTNTRDFDPSGTKTHEYTLGVIFEPLKTIRELLLRPSLNSRDVATLIRAAEALVCNCGRKFTAIPKTRNPSRVIRDVAMVFLALDALVSVSQVLPGKICMGHWWPTFVEPISTDLNSYVPARKMKIAAQRNLDLLSQLLSAIEIYKQGRRPRDKVVIELKRKIFGPNNAIYPFSEQRFDPWRQDDAGTQDGAGHQEGSIASDSDN
ncbi:hypothetical protein Efla_002669 [Eimeria flavescens]